jgi:hypothetical protein
MKRLILSVLCNLFVASLLLGPMVLPNGALAKDPKEQFAKRSKDQLAQNPKEQFASRA